MIHIWLTSCILGSHVNTILPGFNLIGERWYVVDSLPEGGENVCAQFNFQDCFAGVLIQRKLFAATPERSGLEKSVI